MFEEEIAHIYILTLVYSYFYIYLKISQKKEISLKETLRFSMIIMYFHSKNIVRQVYKSSNKRQNRQLQATVASERNIPRVVFKFSK